MAERRAARHRSTPAPRRRNRTAEERDEDPARAHEDARERSRRPPSRRRRRGGARASCRGRRRARGGAPPAGSRCRRRRGRRSTRGRTGGARARGRSGRAAPDHRPRGARARARSTLADARASMPLQRRREPGRAEPEQDHEDARAERDGLLDAREPPRDVHERSGEPHHRADRAVGGDAPGVVRELSRERPTRAERPGGERERADERAAHRGAVAEAPEEPRHERHRDRGGHGAHSRASSWKRAVRAGPPGRSTRTSARPVPPPARAAHEHRPRPRTRPRRRREPRLVPAHLHPGHRERDDHRVQRADALALAQLDRHGEVRHGPQRPRRRARASPRRRRRAARCTVRRRDRRARARRAPSGGAPPRTGARRRSPPARSRRSRRSRR